MRFLPLLTILTILVLALYISTNKKAKSGAQTNRSAKQNKNIPSKEKGKISDLSYDEYLYEYIVDVINNGSSRLHFKKDEVMEGGYISKYDAAGVACYVMELSGRSCKNRYPKEAVGIFTSACGGCHGTDGRGENGAYPDLTRKPLLGIKLLKESFTNN